MRRDVTITDVYDNTSALVGAGGVTGLCSSGFDPGTGLRPCPKTDTFSTALRGKKTSYRQAMKEITEEGVTDRQENSHHAVPFKNILLFSYLPAH